MKAHARILVLLLALAMLLSVCGSQEASGGEPEVKDTLIVGNNAEPTVLDPPNQQNTPAGLINVQVYDGLLRQNNETGEIEPCLAESWEYVDDCTVRFHLRDDVYGRNPVGSGVVADGPITPAISCYVPAGEDQQYEQDIEKAKQLLKEAGYENGFDLASKEMDSEKRNEYYAELQTILRDEMPWLWIRFTDNLFGMQKTLTGLDPAPETYCEFRFVKTK